MAPVKRVALPAEALLGRYASGPDTERNYTDCYETHVRGVVVVADFVAAFYTTWLFKLERWLICVVRRPFVFR